MLKTLTLAGGLLFAGLSLTAAPASAAFLGNGAVADRSPLVDTVQYYGRDRGYRRRGVRPGRIVRRLLGVGPRRGYRGRGYGYGRGYGRSYGGGRGYNRY